MPVITNITWYSGTGIPTEPDANGAYLIRTSTGFQVYIADLTGKMVQQEIDWANVKNVSFGTDAGQVAEGNHTHDDYLQKTGDVITGDLQLNNASAIYVNEPTDVLNGSTILRNVAEKRVSSGSVSGIFAIKLPATGSTMIKASIDVDEYSYRSTTFDLQFYITSGTFNSGTFNTYCASTHPEQFDVKLSTDGNGDTYILVVKQDGIFSYPSVRLREARLQHYGRFNGKWVDRSQYVITNPDDETGFTAVHHFHAGGGTGMRDYSNTPLLKTTTFKQNGSLNDLLDDKAKIEAFGGTIGDNPGTYGGIIVGNGNDNESFAIIGNWDPLGPTLHLRSMLNGTILPYVKMASEGWANATFATLAALATEKARIDVIEGGYATVNKNNLSTSSVLSTGESVQQQFSGILEYNNSASDYSTPNGGALFSSSRGGSTGFHIQGSITEEDNVWYNFKNTTWRTPYRVASRQWANATFATLAALATEKARIDVIEALLASDETSLDTLQEVVDFIQTNREDLQNLTISAIAGLQAALDSKENTFSKNTAFNADFGTESGQVAAGNDSRINNGQTAFDWGNHALAGYAPIIEHTPEGLADPAGVPGALAFDDDYFYFKTRDGWRRVPVEEWIA